MTMTDLAARLATVAGEAASAVADDLRAAFRSGVDVAYKRDAHDPVTVHDRRAEERIREHILAAVPDSTIVGEEGGVDGDGAIHWYVDPIDGTANFAHGVAFFCTSIGAVVDGRPIAGAVLDPIAGHLFTATVDGAYFNGVPLTSVGAARESHALLLTSYPSARELDRDGAAAAGRLARLIDAYGTVRRIGSAALTLSYVAASWADAAFGTSVNGWDICAGQLLVAAAGGHYRPFVPGGGEPGWDAPGYLAQTSTLRAVVLDKVVAEIAHAP